MFTIVHYSRLAITLFHKTPIDIIEKKIVWKSEGLGVHMSKENDDHSNMHKSMTRIKTTLDLSVFSLSQWVIIIFLKDFHGITLKQLEPSCCKNKDNT